MKNVYSLGEQEPFRFTKDSAFRIMQAICATNSEVIASCIETTCPPTHINLRVRVDGGKSPLFLKCCPEFDEVESAGGQS